MTLLFSFMLVQGWQKKPLKARNKSNYLRIPLLYKILTCMSRKCRLCYLNTKRKILRLHGFLTVQPCFDDSIIDSHNTLPSLVYMSKCFSPNSPCIGALSLLKNFFFLTGGCGCTQVKSREMGLGLILKMSPLPGDNNITCKIQKDHKLENHNKF